VADQRSPVTIRITRPYGSENEFIDGDFAWIGRTTIVLANTPARKAGEIIRFEIVLTSGSPVFRGEGSVVGYYPPGGGKPPGLEVRFTRIDARSKLVLDKVRERRTALSRSGELPAAPASLAPAPPQAIQPPARAASERRVVQRTSPHSKVAAPPNRDEILERLRSRAKHLAEHGGFSFKRRSS
jgi:hypothetical protein